MPSIDLETRRTRSFDDQELVYQVTPGAGPWIVLANGLGARLPAWRHQIAYLGDHYRFLAWDYRGLYGDEPKFPPADLDLFDAHARDLAAILRAESIAQPIVAAWSVGMHVVLRAIRDQALRPSHLVLLNGTFQPDPGARASIARARSRALSALGKAGSIVDALAHRAARSPEVVPWAKRLGFVGPTIDEDLFAEVVADFENVNAQPYFRHLAALRAEDSSAMLASIQAPCLVLIGERDPITPRAVAEPAARRIPGAEIFVVRGATHFTALEFPELVNLRIEKFLRERSISPA